MNTPNSPASENTKTPASPSTNEAPATSPINEKPAQIAPQNPPTTQAPKPVVSIQTPPVTAVKTPPASPSPHEAPAPKLTGDNTAQKAPHGPSTTQSPKPTTGIQTPIATSTKTTPAGPSTNEEPTPAKPAPRLVTIDPVEMSKYIAQSQRPAPAKPDTKKPKPPTAAPVTPASVPAENGQTIQEAIKAPIYNPDMTLEQCVTASKNRIKNTTQTCIKTSTGTVITKDKHLAKLLLQEFEQLTDKQAEKAYKAMQDMLLKFSVQRDKPIKVLFTKSEYDFIEKLSHELNLEKARVVRRLAFTGPSKEEILAEFKEIKYQLSKTGGNLTQLCNYLNSKKPGLTDDTISRILKNIEELKQQQMLLNRRLVR